jgi:hypothetical protein
MPRKKRSEPDPALAGSIENAMRATVYGRSLITKDHAELLSSLRGWPRMGSVTSLNSSVTP